MCSRDLPNPPNTESSVTYGFLHAVDATSNLRRSCNTPWWLVGGSLVQGTHPFSNFPLSIFQRSSEFPTLGEQPKHFRLGALAALKFARLVGSKQQFGKATKYSEREP
jgi:hypothetical protein